MSEKIRYEVDPYNRLVVIDKRNPLRKERRVLDGVFSIGKGNSLEYRVKSPASSSEDVPYEVKLKGSWSLTKGHDLRFTFDRSYGGRPGDALVIAGEMIDARKDALLFSVTTKRGDDIWTTYLLEVKGIWQADENNRISFKIGREGGLYDTLLFEGAWEVNDNNEIVYRYERSQLKKRTKIMHSIILRGEWKIAENGVLIYQMEEGSNSAFTFKTSLGICGNDFIKYQIGIMLSRRLRPVMLTITLFGVWRLKRSSALYFDVECADGRIYSISFSAEARLTSRDSIFFRLKDAPALKDIGLDLELNHTLLKGDGHAFLRTLQTRKESSIIIGAGFNW